MSPSTESYEIYYENTDLVVKRLKHGKLDTFESEGNPPIENLQQGQTHLFDPAVPDTTRWFSWAECPSHGYAGWRFPGQGVPYPSCGTFFTLGCLEHSPGYAKRFKMDCARAQCPVDYKTWLAKATNKIVDRVKAGLPRRYSKAIHVTISPPTELWDQFGEKENYVKMRRKAIRLAKTAGIHGGVMIFHPYRGDNKRGWHYAPHFHLICTGWVKSYDQLKKYLHGWLVKNHRIRKSIGATAYYQLSHAGIKDGNNVVGWFGSMAYNKLQPDPRRLQREREERAKLRECPVCGGQLRPVVYLGEGDNPMSDLEAGAEAEIDAGWWSYAV